MNRLFRRRRVLICTFLSAFPLLALLGWMQLHRYESHMVISLSRGHPDPQPAAGAVTSAARLLNSGDLLEQVVLANGMQNASEGSWLNFLQPRQAPTDRVARAVRSLSARIEVETSSKTNLITVAYRSPDPDLAYRVLNSLGSFYIKKETALNRRPSSNQSLTPQTESYQAALDDADAGLRAVGLSQPVADPTAEAQSHPTGLELNDADLEREAKDKEKKYLLYLSRRERQRTSDAHDSTRMESVAIVVPPARAVLVHSSVSILLAALMVAVLASILLTFLTDYFDPSFHTPAQVIDILGIPIVIAMPKRTA